MKQIQVTENVVLYRIPQGSNIVCVSLEDELIFIDTGLNTVVATDFRKQMEKKFSKKASTLILTHAHIDHFLAMKTFSDCLIVAAETAKERFQRFVNFKFTEEVLENMSKVFPSIKTAATIAKISMPQLWVKESKAFGKNEELVFEVRGGHSSCSSSILYKPERILMVGDLIQAYTYPYFGEPDTDMDKWINSLKEWEREDLQYILPGHGGILEKNYLTDVREYFEKVIIALKQFKEQNLTEEEVIKQSIFSEGYWPKSALRRSAYDYSILNLYRRLE